MKKILMWCSFLPGSVFAHEATEKNSHVWSIVFSDLVKTRQWDQARSIAPIGEQNFKDTTIWSTPSFQKTWQIWQKGNAYSLWKAGADQHSMWRLADGLEKNRPTIGVRKEGNGSLWLLFARPPQTPLWKCSSCSIAIQVNNGRSQQWTVRSPKNQEETSVLGMKLPGILFANEPRQWRVTFPDGSVSVFDVSYTPMVCEYKVEECRGLWNSL